MKQLPYDVLRSREDKKEKLIFEKNSVKVYIYGVVNDYGDIVYVGESVNPKTRLTNHKSDAIILDYYYSVEHYYINMLRKRGFMLRNKESLISGESVDYEIGDLITYLPVKGRKRKDKSSYWYRSKYHVVHDKSTGESYKSVSEASRMTGVDYGIITYDCHRRKKDHKQRFSFTDPVKVYNNFLGKFLRLR